MQKIVLSDTFFIFIADTVDSYVKGEKRHVLWDKSLKTCMRLFKSTAHPAIAFGIHHCLLLALFLIAFFFCKVRDTLTRGLFDFINIFVHMMLKCYWKAPAGPANLSVWGFLILSCYFCIISLSHGFEVFEQRSSLIV